MKIPRCYDAIISCVWLVVLLISDVIIPNRLLRLSIAVITGIACYSVTAKPRANLVLFLIAMSALSGCWVNEDRITSLLTQMFARH